LGKFRDHFPDHDLTSIKPEEVLSFLTSLNGECKQLTKHTRYAYLKALFNFIRTNLYHFLFLLQQIGALTKLHEPSGGQIHQSLCQGIHQVIQVGKKTVTTNVFF
jgi:hypothetical protein